MKESHESSVDLNLDASKDKPDTQIKLEVPAKNFSG